MKIIIDTEEKTIEVSGSENFTCPLYSKQSLDLLSELWLKVEWNELHWKSLSWLGLPMWQLPEDVLRLQEFVWHFKPDVIVETGVNLGGSALFFASMCRLLGKGSVVSVDIEIPSAVREAVESHEMSEHVTLIEGDSVSAAVLDQVKGVVAESKKVLVFLDSDHSYSHVLKELDEYSKLLPVGSYIVATDGVMEILGDVPLGSPTWVGDNPMTAAKEFASKKENFVIERPKAKFHEEKVIEGLTYWPSAWIKRIN